jgi:hypothetical protein
MAKKRRPDLWTGNNLLNAWLALPTELSGKDWMEYNRLRAFAHRNGIQLPPRLTAKREDLKRKGDLTYGEFIAAWDALPVPVVWSDQQGEYHRLRRMAKRLGYTIPRRPNPGQERLKERGGDMRHRPEDDIDW